MQSQVVTKWISYTASLMSVPDSDALFQHLHLSFKSAEASFFSDQWQRTDMGARINVILETSHSAANFPHIFISTLMTHNDNTTLKINVTITLLDVSMNMYTWTGRKGYLNIGNKHNKNNLKYYSEQVENDILIYVHL